MSMGHTYKFFGFSMSYTFLNLLLSILYLPIMLLIPYTNLYFLIPFLFSPILLTLLLSKCFLFHPSCCSLVDWVPDYELKCCQFYSLLGHMPGLRARSPFGGMEEATNRCFFPSLFPSLPLFLKINKLRKKCSLYPWVCFCFVLFILCREQVQ